MKPTTRPAPLRSQKDKTLPKARVMFTYVNHLGEKCVQAHKRDLDRDPWTVVVLPCATAQQARSLARAANQCGPEVLTRLAELLAQPAPKPNKMVKPHPIVRGMTGASFDKGHNMMLGYAPLTDSDACVVVPCATRKEAQSLAEFLGRSEEEQMEQLEKTGELIWAHDRTIARIVLRALKGGGKWQDDKGEER